MCQCNFIKAEMRAAAINLTCECGNPHLTAEETATLNAVAQYLRKLILSPR
jgi:hypothetical protein